MNKRYTRREMLRLTGQAAVATALTSRLGFAAENRTAAARGVVVGNSVAAQVGEKILAGGGNAIDAIVAAALTAGVTAPNQCGIGGYGGHMVIALASRKKVTAIDFNSTAPMAAHEDMFPLNERGQVRGQVNEHGWLAAGVPGTLAGLQLALDRYGTRSFRELVAPGIQFAREGFPITAGLAASIHNAAAQIRKDPASARLLLKDGGPPGLGDTFRNPDLADMLETLTKHNSVDSFYRGDIARRIADEFKKHGGLVTFKDLAAYRAMEVEPLQMTWRGCTVCTAPLTAGGLSVLEAIAILKALNWEALPAGLAKTQAKIETLRVAWHDRLTLLGDPKKVKVPSARLLSTGYATGLAKKVEAAVRDKKPVSLQTETRAQGGTVHLSCVDKHGNMVALTLTHGNAFGAQITVDGLGLILGHGMSRFNPHPGHPNSPEPGKRPLNNMCPTVVLREGKPVLALGGAGGRKIPNAILEVLTQYIGLDANMEDAIAAPRLHTEGDLDLTLERQWPQHEAEFLKSLGYTVTIGVSALVSAVSFNAKTGECRGASR